MNCVLVAVAPYPTKANADILPNYFMRLEDTTNKSFNLLIKNYFIGSTLVMDNPESSMIVKPTFNCP